MRLYDLALQFFSFFLLIFAVISSAMADPKRAQRFTVEMGLSQSTIYAIHLGQDGRMWFATAEGISIWSGDEFEYIFRDIENENGLPSNYISDLLGDDNGNVYVATLGGGVSVFAHNGTFLRHIDTIIAGTEVYDVTDIEWARDGTLFAATHQGVVGIEGPRSGTELFLGQSFRSIEETSDGSIWAGTFTNGAFRIKPDGRKVEHFKRSEGNLDATMVNRIFEDSRRTLWLGSEDNGLFRWDEDSSTFQHTLELGAGDVPVIYEALDSRLWFGSWTKGLFVHDPNGGHTSNFRSLAGNTDSLSSNTVVSLGEDSSGGMWVGTYDAGVNRVRSGDDPFEAYLSDEEGQAGPESPMVWALKEDSTGRLWIGTKSGLSLRESSGKFRTIESGLDREDVRAFLNQNDRLLVAFKRRGLVAFDDETLVPKRVLDAEGNPLLVEYFIRLLEPDHDGTYWVGTHSGVFHVSGDDQVIAHYTSDADNDESLPHDRVRSLYLEDDGTLWVGSSGGLSRLDRAAETFVTYAGLDWLPGDDVRGINRMRSGEMLVATGSGLAKIDFDAGRSTFFTRSDGLPSEGLYGLIADRTGAYWIPTNNGLVRFDPVREEIQPFFARDGLQGNEFNFNAYASLSNGKIAVGGVNGLSLFDPLSVKIAETPPKIYISFAEGEGVIVRTISDNEMDIDGRKMALNVEVRHFDDPTENRLTWRLDPIDTEWSVRSGVSHRIERENLPADNYTLLVKAIAPRGTESEIRQLTFAVPTNPYLSWPAAALYALSLALLGYGFSQYRARKIVASNMALEEAVDQKTRELENANMALEKSAATQASFYARAAHEIRTPLSLIQAPIQKLVERDDLSLEVRQTLSTVDRSTRRLSVLTDGMIAASDRREHLPPGRALVSLGGYLGPIIRLYENLAVAHGSELQSSSPLGMAVVIKTEPMETILHNLLSNAIRHSEPGSVFKLDISVAENELVLNLEGQGIMPEGAIAALQAHADGDGNAPASHGMELVGAGIAELEGRFEIACDSDALRVICPLTTIAHEPLSIQAEGLSDSAKQSNQPNILIIEDDADLRTFLMAEIAQLGAVCGVENLHDAAAALETAKIELILSDIMLPDGDGIDFCSRVKSDLATSHIPVIFLSALSDHPSRMATLRAAGDDFIGKPFDPEILVAKVRNRLSANVALRRHLVLALQRDKESENEEARAEAHKLSTQDREFRERFERYLADFAHDPNISLKATSRACGVGERSLQRKLSALYGQSFIEILSEHRMRMAMMSLKAGKPVKQVAIECGYRSHSSFSRKFKECFGNSPSDA